MEMESPLYRGFFERGAKERRRQGIAFMDCPFCGHEAKSHEDGKLAVFANGGFHCCVCQKSGKHRELWDALALGSLPEKEPIPVQKKEKTPPSWLRNPDYYINAYTSHFDRLSLWQSYKPLTIDTIAVHRLGVGVLPLYASLCQHKRLIYPIFNEKGTVTGLRGRSLSCDCDKWISASGTTAQLQGVQFLKQGCNLVIAENYIDCLLLHQTRPDWIGVAPTGGAGCWRDEWSLLIASYKPSRVVVFYDNDLAGIPNPVSERRWKEEWRKKMALRVEEGKIQHIPTHPTPSGYKVLQSLQRAGIKSGYHRWRETDKEHEDLGGYLIQRYF